MKRILLLFFAVGSLAALSSCNNENYISSENIATSFSSRPPQSSYPWVWWHWMEGNITKEGIRKDLLWMHDVGVGGLHQFDAEEDTPHRLLRKDSPICPTNGRMLSAMPSS